jgi:hypothetical protein
MGVSVNLAITLIWGMASAVVQAFSPLHWRHGECCGQPVIFAKIDILLSLGGY